MKKSTRVLWLTVILILAVLVIGQVLSFLIAPESWRAFIARLPVIISMIAFWGPIMAILCGIFVWATFRMLGFQTLEEIRQESIEQNNPAPAIIFIGALIASLLFFLLIVRP